MSSTQTGDATAGKKEDEGGAGKSQGEAAKKAAPAAEVFPQPSAVQKNMLHQKLTAKEHELRQALDKLRAADRQIKGLNTQLSEVKKSRREVTAELEELKEKVATAAAAPPAAAPPPQPADEPSSAQPSTPAGTAEATPFVEIREGLGDEHKALASRLLEEGLKLDLATLAAAAAGLRDTSVLEQQLRRARDDSQRLQMEIQQLNDTVFSKSFKPPSAWADREVKYKMEKRAWEQQVSSLKEQIKSLKEENRGYRESNKAAEFEQQIKELNAAVKAADAEKTAAQQGMHELQLQMREMEARHKSERQILAPENASVLNKILSMEDKGGGAVQPRATVPSHGHLRRDSAGSSDREIHARAADGSEPILASEIRTDLQELIEEYDERGILIKRPATKKRSKAERPEAFDRGAADANGELSDAENVSVDLDAIKSDLRRDSGTKALGSDAGSPRAVGSRRGSTSLPDPSDGGVATSRGPSRMQNVGRPGKDADGAEVEHSGASGRTHAEASRAPPVGEVVKGGEKEEEVMEGQVSVDERAVEIVGGAPVFPGAAKKEASSRSLKSDKVADVVAGAPEEEVSFEADTVRNAVMNIGEDDILPQPAAAPSGELAGGEEAAAPRGEPIPETGGEGLSDVASAASKLEGQHPPPTPAAGTASAAAKPAGHQASASETAQGTSYPTTDRSDDIPHIPAARNEGEESSEKAGTSEPGRDPTDGVATAAQGSPAVATAADNGTAARGTLAVASAAGNATTPQAISAVATSPSVETANDPAEGFTSGREARESELDTQQTAKDQAGATGRGGGVSEIEADPEGADGPSGGGGVVRVAAGEIQEESSGPMSPASPFGGQDDGHVTGAVGEEQAKGGANAMALARRRSLGDEEITRGPGGRLELSDGGKPRSVPRGHPVGSQPQSFSEIEPMEGASPPKARRQPAVAPRPRPKRLGSGGLGPVSSELLTRGSSDDDSPWTNEKRSALQAERDAVEEELLEHLADQDVKQLKWRAALMESRVEMHEAQITKMQRALEEADQEKARLEEDLEVALRAGNMKSLGSADRERIQSIREQLREDSSAQAERSKVTEEALQESYREVQSLQKQRASLQKQLAHIASKLDSGMIPGPEDLELPAIEEEEAPASSTPGGAPKAGAGVKVAVRLPRSLTTKRSLQQYNSFVEGLSEQEIEVMQLRQENENVMDTLVRTKVELAETQGDYLKMRRALIRAVEKQASVTDKLDSIKYAVTEGEFERIKGIMEESKPANEHGGDIESLGERNLY